MLRSRNALNVILLLAVVMCALSVVTSQHKARKLYIELQQEKEHAQQMDVEWGQLQLEQSTWATPARVEKISAQQLQMHLPKNGEIQFIRLGPPSPQSSDGTTSHLTKLPKNDSQVIGYPVNGESVARGAKPGNSPLSLREKGSENFNGHIDKQP